MGLTYLSTGAFCTNSLSEIIAFSLQHGIDHIELSSGLDYNPDIPDLAWEAWLEDGIHFLIHNYCPPPEDPFVLNLAMPGDRRSSNLCGRAITIAACLGAPFYSVHGGWAFSPPPSLLGDPLAEAQLPSIPHDVARGALVENVRLLAEYARNRDIQLLIENNVVSAVHTDSLPLTATAKDIMQLMHDVCMPNLGLLLDVGHLKVSANTLGFQAEQFIEEVAPYIGAFHLSDNNGLADQHLPFGEDAWFAPFLRDFPDLPVVIETFNISWEQMQRQIDVVEAMR